MKLSIFGRHPVPQGGFNGVMSLFEAIEFSRLGYDTTLLLPFEDGVEFAAFLGKHRLTSLDELSRFGGRFDIVPVFPDGENFPDADVLIYQSYAVDDWNKFRDLCRKKSRIFTKNFPKFVYGPGTNEGVTNQMKTFDVVACALKEDYDLIYSNPEYRNTFPNGFAYVPRGASPTMLHAGYKLGLPPTLGFDVPNGDDSRALEHYFAPVERLRKDIPELRVLTIGRAVSELRSEVIPFGRFDRIYEKFFNRIHVYCTINYEYSPGHLQASVQAIAEGWGKKAIYEVQNIEAQMSGAVLFGHRDNIISELYTPGVTGLNFTDFQSEGEIYQSLKAALAHWHEFGPRVRTFAERNFSWNICIERWRKAIEARLGV